MSWQCPDGCKECFREVRFMPLWRRKEAHREAKNLLAVSGGESRKNILSVDMRAGRLSRVDGVSCHRAVTVVVGS